MAIGLLACGGPLESQDELLNEGEVSASESEDAFQVDAEPNQDIDALQQEIRFKVGKCHSAADNVHVTNGEASGHAWWEDRSSDCTISKATVTIRLQAVKGGRWVNMTNNTIRRNLNPGRGKSANARVKCKGTGSTNWRSAFEVDYQGAPDLIQWHYSVPARLPCGA